MTAAPRQVRRLRLGPRRAKIIWRTECRSRGKGWQEIVGAKDKAQATLQTRMRELELQQASQPAEKPLGAKERGQLTQDRDRVGARPVSYTHLTLPTNREV